jgi:hypothetical protein
VAAGENAISQAAFINQQLDTDHRPPLFGTGSSEPATNSAGRVEAQASKGAVMTYRSWDFSASEVGRRMRPRARVFSRVSFSRPCTVKRFFAHDRLGGSIGQMSTEPHRNHKNCKNDKMRYRLCGIYKRQGLHDRAALEARVINCKLCSLCAYAKIYFGGMGGVAVRCGKGRCNGPLREKCQNFTI